MSGGSDFEMTKLTLHNMLNELKSQTLSAVTQANIVRIQRMIAALEEQ